MGTMFLSEIKKQASSFIHDKYKSARLVLTDVTQAELLTEEATNNDPSGPDARTMARISEAAFDIDDYWRIVDLLHQRLYIVDWKQWRQQYKALVLLDFLLTHGPESVAEEFQCDMDVIQELGSFKHIDEQGFNWGDSMQKKSVRILQLLDEEELLKDERSKAIKVSKEIKGFGNLIISPSLSSLQTSRSWSFGSHSSSSSPSCNEPDEFHRHELQPPNKEFKDIFQESHEKSTSPSAHLWDTPIEETGLLLDPEEEEETKEEGFSTGISPKPAVVTHPGWWDGRKVVFRNFSNVGKVMKKKIDRQFSMGV
ncbi:uncharacterized protein LOC131240421 [Magnolia sinica]|uniref:uncharacterized protein LOC131240421 n=1 Tax=Magnolia sinica TaxID=86752 RepID=UPI002658B077|nr:uncharacterized protein LOC131240421 [Magnolia sinica]XP_058094620.1 uncharacterized protein LOC131240421 [Magnolia sinica]